MAPGAVRSNRSDRRAVPSLMDLALPRFADPEDQLARPHHPWIVITDSPASPSPVRLTGPLRSPSPCLNLDALSSDESAGPGDILAVVICISDDSSIPVDPDQVMSDDDLPTAVRAEDRRQVIRRAVSDTNPAFGMQLHHPWFLEFIGAPESARLLYHFPAFWIQRLGEEDALVAAVILQRDAGIMLSNLQICSQFVTSLHRMSSEMMTLGMGRVVFSSEEVTALATAPRAPWAAKYMAAMGLWRPQTGPGDPGPVPASSCNDCVNCRYCFPEGPVPPGE